MENIIEVKIFRIKDNINLPLKSNPNEVADCNIGDHLICIDGKNVYARHWLKEDGYILLLQDLKFIELNTNFFEKIN